MSAKNKHPYLTASFQDNLGKPVPERKSHSMDFNEARNDDFGMVVALAEPYAISVTMPTPRHSNFTVWIFFMMPD